MIKAKKYRKVKIEKKSKSFVLAWIFVILFFFGTILTTIQTVTMGATLAGLEEENAKLVEENEKINEKLFQSTSLTKISKEAEDLGYIKPSSIIYINSEVPVAKLP
jgi:hypothetical protein